MRSAGFHALPETGQRTWQGLLLLALLAFSALATAQTGPTLIQSLPVDGAQGVAPELGRIRLVFDRPMRTTAMSVLGVQGYATPPLVPLASASAYWPDDRTCELPLQRLAPNTDYALQLNSRERTGFQSSDRQPLAPTVLRFRTGDGTAPAATQVPPAGLSPAAPSLVGTWLVRTPEIEIEAVLRADGTFGRRMRNSEGTHQSQGRYQVAGDRLSIYPDQDAPVTFLFRLVDANTLEVTDDNGDGVRMIRQSGAPPVPPASQPPPAPAATSPAGDRALPTLIMQRRWEPNEHAYSLRVPQGWQMEGGILNVSPLQTNGPGNSLLPKNDLTIRSDAEGRVMSRWFPSWNYADFSVEQSPAAPLFPPGSRYQGMEVKAMPSAEEFLQELFARLRPGASNMRIVARDSYPEIQRAYQESMRAVDQTLIGLGKRPTQVDALGLTIDYTEQGTRYREGLFTAILDLRSGGLMWSNELTYSARAPLAEADRWRPVLETVRNSLQFDPAWLQSARIAGDERARTALETQRYINKVNQEIYENRARTNAEINHEDYLMITGQDEYINPYTQEVERDTSQYRHRWVNANGDYIYSDDGSFDPNRDRTLNQVDWKTTPVRPR